MYTIRAFATLYSGLYFSEEISISTDIRQTVICLITSQAITPYEQALGKFTCCKLKGVDVWNSWVVSERKQLNQFYDLQMVGKKSILCPNEKNDIILCSYWQYYVKRDEQHCAGQYCD